MDSGPTAAPSEQETDASGGCGCRVANRGPRAQMLFVAIALGLSMRRRRARATREV
jgi:MYXO-CTERM domain-containing protein